MKRAASLFPGLLWAVTLIFPVGSLLSAYLGYTLTMSVLSTGAGLSVVAVILDGIYKPSIKSKVVGVLLATLVPLSLVNAVFYVVAYRRAWMIACVLVSVGCCCYLSLRHGKPFPLTVASLALSAIMVLPLIFGCFFLMAFPLGQNTVVQSVASPHGTYVAQVVDSDQGALGGDTIVQVQETKIINCLLFTLKKKPQRVYMGDWGEFETMRIYWENEECLVINGTEHKIA